MRLVWNDHTPDKRGLHWAASIRGWLFARTTTKDWPNVERKGIGWIEPNSLGNYLDYGPNHYRSPHEYCTEGACRCRLSQPGNIHCVAYGLGCRYVETVEQAKAWIEEQVRLVRPELFDSKAA